MKPSANGPESCQLSICDLDEANGRKEFYKYKGKASSAKDLYAVLLDSQTKKCVLTQVDSQYAFNLISTPKEKDVTRVQQQYEQIKLHEPIGSSSDVEDDLFGDAEDQPSEDGSEAGSSVFDWRNFVARGRSTSPDGTIGTPRVAATSAQNTPLLRAQGTKPSVASKPKTQPRSQNEPPKSNPRDVFKPRKKAASPLVAPTRKAAPATAKGKKSVPEPVPNIRVERRASTHPKATENNTKERAEGEDVEERGWQTEEQRQMEDEDEDDVGDLVLDFDSPTVPSKRPSAFGLAAASTGPISLRSAASSPASRLGSPAMRHNRSPSEEDMDLEIEVPDADEPGPTSYTFDDGDDDDDDDMEGGNERGGDSDVDALQLPSPVADTRGSSEVGKRALSPPDEMDEDENVDLEAEMLQALASDDDEGQYGGSAIDRGAGVQEESESESEAE